MITVNGIPEYRHLYEFAFEVLSDLEAHQLKPDVFRKSIQTSLDGMKTDEEVAVECTRTLTLELDGDNCYV